MVWIKICGITRASDGEAISSMGADCLGFIFSTDSPRKISLEKAKNVVGNIGKVEKAGVFVNEKAAMVIKYVEQLGLDHAQLSGDEDIDYIKEIRRAAPRVNIIKAIRVREDSAVSDLREAIKDFNTAADYILLDSFDKDKYGGTGKTIDWNLAKDLAGAEKLILSGGLGYGNIYKALCAVEPSGIDASSKLEAAPGIKNLESVEKFIDEVRRYEKQL